MAVENQKIWHTATGGPDFTNDELMSARCLNVRNCKLSDEEMKHEIKQYFHKTFTLYEKLFFLLDSREAFYIRPKHNLRHPLIFYYGHTATFYMNKLVVAGFTTRINSRIEEMCAIGVDEMSWDDLNSAHYDWPTVEELHEYRRQVRDRVCELVDKMPLKRPIVFTEGANDMTKSFHWIMQMGAEHERIHLETSLVLIRELPLRLVRPLAMWAAGETRGNFSSAPHNELLPVAAGRPRLGRKIDSDLYGWDCDYARDGTTEEVQPFNASKFLVSNAEYLAFMKENGYGRQELWDEEGWNFVQFKARNSLDLCPWFWVPDDSSFKLRYIAEIIPMPWNWPVEVNNLEAQAFCRWKALSTGLSIRLPTEGETLQMFDLYVGKDMLEWGEKPPGNLNLEYGATLYPVDHFAHGPFFDVTGNAWQHTCTPTYPFPGYQTHPVYDDFSAPTFDGRHSMQKGGAFIATGNEATRDARYAFRRHFYQIIGIRYVESVHPVNEMEKMACMLGADPLTDAAADFGYGKFDPQDPMSQFANFPVRLAQIAKKAFVQHHASGGKGSFSALDMFCGSGRTAFELSDTFTDVMGVDMSARPLQIAFAMKERIEYTYSVRTTGAHREQRRILSTDYPWKATRDNVVFYQADPANLHAHIRNFDLLVANFLLDRAYSPKRVFGQSLPERLRSGAIVVCVSAYNWDETLNDPSEWLSGQSIKDAVSPLDRLKQIMAPNFDLVQEPFDELVLRRESLRVAKLHTAQITIWRKKI